MMLSPMMAGTVAMAVRSAPQAPRLCIGSPAAGSLTSAG